MIGSPWWVPRVVFFVKRSTSQPTLPVVQWSTLFTKKRALKLYILYIYIHIYRTNSCPNFSFVRSTTGQNSVATVAQFCRNHPFYMQNAKQLNEDTRLRSTFSCPGTGPTMPLLVDHPNLCETAGKWYSSQRITLEVRTWNRSSFTHVTSISGNQYPTQPKVPWENSSPVPP